MKKLLVLVCATATISLATGAAFADSIKGKLGATGRIGFIIPSDGDINSNKNETDTGYIAGAGVIYGIDNNIAVEIDLTHSVFDSNYGDFSVTTVALGGQYRVALDQPELVPYLGAGLDLLFTEADQGLSVDTTLGAHVSAGIDYFITRQLALTAEARIVVAPETDISGQSGEKGNFDPTSFASTLGFRYFFN
jgi:outer membrane protein